MPRLDMADLRAAVKKVQVDDEVMQLHTAFIHRVLNMVDGAAAVLSNGRVGEPFAPYFKLCKRCVCISHLNGVRCVRNS